jgi:hypothetical protein
MRDIFPDLLLGGSLIIALTLVGFTLWNKFPNTTSPAPSKVELCLIANEIDTETGNHMVVKVRENQQDYFVTGDAWDYKNSEWVQMSPKLIEKSYGFYYVTEIGCPREP